MQVSELRELLMKVKDGRRSELDIGEFHAKLLIGTGFAKYNEMPPMSVAYDLNPTGMNPSFEELPKSHVIGDLTPDGEKLLTFLARLTG